MLRVVAMPFVRTRSLGVAALAILVAVSCSSTPNGTISIVTGDETDVFSRAPAPVTLGTEKIALDGKRTEVSRATLPTDTISLGELPQSEIGGVAVTGWDSTGQAVVRGESLFVQWGALENMTLEVFVQRTNELARMPHGPDAIEPSAATMVAGRYILLANGTSATIYDLLTLSTLSSPPTLPRPAKSLATAGTAVLVIDDTGATTLDLSSRQTYAFDPPTGGTFAEIAGGAQVIASDGSQYIVGGTRTSGGPSARVLRVDASGTASFASLTAPREGACATFVDGRGLVVYGGNGAAAGGELLTIDGAVATPLPFPSDAVTGCAAAKLDSGHVLVAGGTGAPGDTGGGAPARVLDLACATQCAPVAWPDSIPLVRTQAMGLATDAVFLLGDDTAGASHAYRASAAGLREIPLKRARRGAKLIGTPIAPATIVGGAAGIEQYQE